MIFLWVPARCFSLFFLQSFFHSISANCTTVAYVCINVSITALATVFGHRFFLLLVNFFFQFFIFWLDINGLYALIFICGIFFRCNFWTHVPFNFNLLPFFLHAFYSFHPFATVVYFINNVYLCYSMLRLKTFKINAPT